MRLFGRELGFAKKPNAPVASGEAAWSESSMYSGADFPKYNPDALIGRKGYAIYSKMMLDEQIKAVVRFKRDAITSRDHAFTCDHDALSEDEKKKRIYIFNKIIEKMEAPFTDALNGIMSSMYNGFSLTEKVTQPIEVDGTAWMGIKRLKLRPCDTFQFHVDEYGNIEAVTQQYEMNEQDIDITRFIHFVQNPDYDEHYGRSELRECYRAYFSKDMIIKFQNIHLERFAAGFVWVAPKDGKQLSQSSPEFTTLKNVLSNLQATSSIILPGGYDLNIEHPATTDAFERAISQHDKSIAKALLVPNLMGISEQGSTGSYSQSQTQLEAFLWTLDADATRLEAALNQQLFKELGDLNFGDGMYPQFKFKPVSDTRKLEIVKIWQQLVTAGAVQATDADEAYLREALELPRKPVIEGDAPDLILNGAQVTSLVGIVGQVGSGTLSPEAAKALITAVFPITEEQAAKMVDSAKVEQPEPVAGPSGQPVGADDELPAPTKPDGTPLTPQEEETIVGKMGISVSAFRTMFWNEDQPRDEAGKWGEGGGGGGATLTSKTPKEFNSALEAAYAAQGVEDWQKDYITAMPLRGYFGNEQAFEINRGLRDGKKMNPRAKAAAKAVEEGFTKNSIVLAEGTTLHRAVSGEFAQQLQAMPKGTSFIDKGYLSTAGTTKATERFGNVRMELKVGKGLRGLAYRDESEVLLDKGRKLTVGKTRMLKGVTVIEVHVS